MAEPAVWPRLLASLGAVALGAVAVVIVGVLGHRTPGPVDSSAAVSRAPAASSGGSEESKFPSPPPNAVVFSRPDDSDVLALAVSPGRKVSLQASVVDGQGQGVGDLDVSFRVGSKIAVAEPCGAGCYRAVAPEAGVPKSVLVTVRRDRRVTKWNVPLPRPWPPRNASLLVAEATRTFRALDSLAIHDRLASDAQHAVVTRWRVVAPDKLAYKIEGGGPEGVIIGQKRWDKAPGGEWEQAAQTPVHQPTPFWKTWKNAHVLATTKGAWRVSFFDPTTPGWYELTIQRQTMRPLEMYMRAKAHFMHDVYSAFNEPIEISPPR